MALNPTPVPTVPDKELRDAKINWANPAMNGIHRINYYDAAGRQVFCHERPMVEVKLTEKEAQALQFVFANVGGSPAGLRGQVDSVIAKLAAKGVPQVFNSFGVATGSVRFSK